MKRRTAAKFIFIGNLTRKLPLKIRLHCKQELLDKDFLESSDVILFVEHEHSLLIVDGVNGSERNRAIAICY